MILNGHELVSSGHPEDDDPWCRKCQAAGRGLDRPCLEVTTDPDPTPPHGTPRPTLDDVHRSIADRYPWADQA